MKRQHWYEMLNLQYLSIVTVMYCVCMVSATFARFMNYINVITIALIIAHIIITRKIGKSVLGILWAVFILVYPIGDAALRGESELLLFTTLCYVTPMLFLIIGDFEPISYSAIVVSFLKFFAWFQVFGIVLQKVWTRAHIVISWRLLGYWTSAVTGFTTHQTVAAYIICFGVGAYFIEYIIIKKQNRRTGLRKLFCSILMFISMVATGKRSFLIATISAIILVLLINTFYSMKRFIKTVFGGSIAVIAALIVSLKSYQSGANNAFGRMGAVIDGIVRGEDVTNMRSTWATYMNEWRYGYEKFGIGWGSFLHRISFTSYGDTIKNGHNVYLQILCEIGYVGLSVFILLLLLTLIATIKNVLYFSKQKNIRMLGPAMFSLFVIWIFIVYAYFGNAIYDSWAYLYFFAGIQMAMMLKRIRKNQRQI